ncbi:hypothetical protein [Macrococcus equi]|uniref:hypothetical protein n=1 Tax=Macrococcus equi TaxID=3395462 RepID=UPI0039BE1416
MTVARFLKLILLQYLCSFIMIQIGLASGGFSFMTLVISSFVLFAILYVAWLYPKWTNQN